MLSLDAPTVAAVWAWSFAHTSHVTLPLYSLAILALGTWAIYISDRLLDGWRTLPPSEMRERHYFHRRHWIAMTVTICLISATLLGLIFTCMPSAAREEDTILFLFALIYFAAVHFRLIRQKRWFPKELIVGIIFAAATAVPAWSRLMHPSVALAGAVALFALLCWLNCTGIERWESYHRCPHPHFPGTLTAIAGLGLVAWIVAQYTRSATAPLYAAEMLSTGLLLLLEKSHIRLTPMALRVFADLVLLTPLLTIPWLS